MTSSVPPFKRIGDHTLQYEFQDKARLGDSKTVDPLKRGNHLITRKVRIKLPSEDPVQFNKLQALLDRIIRNNPNQIKGSRLLNKTLVDPLTKTRWKIQKETTFFSVVIRILKFFNLLHFFHMDTSPIKSNYVLKQDRTFWQWVTRQSFINKLPMNLEMDKHEVAPDETLRGLRGEDALTKLSTKAYQNYESDFYGKDNKNVGEINSCFAILMNEGALQLVPRHEARGKQDQAIEALEHCKRHYESLRTEKDII